jgi:hypothetical protein
VDDGISLSGVPFRVKTGVDGACPPDAGLRSMYTGSVERDAMNELGPAAGWTRGQDGRADTGVLDVRPSGCAVLGSFVEVQDECNDAVHVALFTGGAALFGSYNRAPPCSL